MRASVVAVGGLDEVEGQEVQLDVQSDPGAVADLADHGESDLAGRVQETVVSRVG